MAVGSTDLEKDKTGIDTLLTSDQLERPNNQRRGSGIGPERGDGIWSRVRSERRSNYAQLKRKFRETSIVIPQPRRTRSGPKCFKNFSRYVEVQK